ncbi:uncharacterized protein [Asterias amurensis]|uniref:uncharacterized protein isoform X2 n=1 Tax=Asterias amurensis TaxID=7602 RepID=UPI003AB4E567
MKSLSIIVAAGAIGAGIAGVAAVFFKTRTQRKTSPWSQDEICMQEAVSRATWQDILDHAKCLTTRGNGSKWIRCCRLSVVDMRTDPCSSGSSGPGTSGIDSYTVDESGSSDTKTVASTSGFLEIGLSIDVVRGSDPKSGYPEFDRGSVSSIPITNSSASDVVKDKVVFVCKIKKGCMGRIIGKKGRKLKEIKSELHVDFLHGTLDEKYAFVRLEDDVEAAKALAYQSIQTGIVEIAPSDIENRIANDDDIVTENLYHVQTQHGRVVGQNGVNLNHMRSLGVGVSTSTEHHLKVLTIKGTPERVQHVHEWIRNNIAEKSLFVPAPLPGEVLARWSDNAPTAIESA